MFWCSHWPNQIFHSKHSIWRCIVCQNWIHRLSSDCSRIKISALLTQPPSTSIPLGYGLLSYTAFSPQIQQTRMTAVEKLVCLKTKADLVHTWINIWINNYCLGLLANTPPRVLATQSSSCKSVIPSSVLRCILPPFHSLVQQTRDKRAIILDQYSICGKTRGGQQRTFDYFYYFVFGRGRGGVKNSGSWGTSEGVKPSQPPTHTNRALY